MTDDVFTPTPAALWVDPNPAREVELPSGNKAVVKKPNLYILGRTGQVPADVKKAAGRVQKARATHVTVSAAEAAEALADFEVYVDWIVTRCFIAPRVTLDGSGESLALSAVSSDDKRYVVSELGIEV
jgi:hypothetical protein